MATDTTSESSKIENEDILSQLECPVCYDYICPPIRQCEKGHLLCKDCFPKCPKCPTCRSNMSEERNFAIEKVASLLNYPCRFHTLGCKDTNKFPEKEEHEKNCKYVQINCPFHMKCKYFGSLFEIEKHLKMVHNVNPIPVQPSGIFFYRCQNFFRRNIFNMIFKWDGYLFRFLANIVHAEKIGKRKSEGAQILAHIQYIGAVSKLAAKYAYTLELFEPKSKKKGMKYESVVTNFSNLEDHLEDVFIESVKNCKKYIEDDRGSLGFMIYMKRLSEEEPIANESIETESTLESQPGPSNNENKSEDSKSQKRKASSPLPPLPGPSQPGCNNT